MNGLHKENSRESGRKQAEVEASWASTGFPQPWRSTGEERMVATDQRSREGRDLACPRAENSFLAVVFMGWAGCGADC